MMCPFCGEDLPDGASRCTRCQADLGGGDEAAPEQEMCPFCGSEVDPGLPRCPDCGTELSAGDEDDDAPEKKVLHLVECHRCEAEVPTKRHRCPECGALLQELTSADAKAEHQALKTRAYLIGAGLVALLVIIVMFMAMGGEESTDPVDVSFDTLYQGMSGQDKLRKAKLKKDYDDKYVKWTGTVVQADGKTLFVRHGPLIEGKLPDVKVQLSQAPSSPPAEGSSVTYVGRIDLDVIGQGGYFTVTSAQLE